MLFEVCWLCLCVAPCCLLVVCCCVLRVGRRLLFLVGVCVVCCVLVVGRLFVVCRCV